MDTFGERVWDVGAHAKVQFHGPVLTTVPRVVFVAAACSSRKIKWYSIEHIVSAMSTILSTWTRMVYQ